MKKIWVNLAGLGTILCLTIINVFAVGSGGYENQVPSARAMGRANSVVASIDDASATSFNPARLTAIQASQISLGLTIQKLATKYDSGTGFSQEAEHETGLTPNVHAASKFGSDKWAFGLGINVPHGIATKWAPNTPMALVATETNLSVVDVNPAVAYRINDQLSIGAGIDYYKVKIKLNNQPDFDDGVSDFDSSIHGDGDGFGGNIGFSFMPSEANMFGLSYRSGANIDVEGDSDTSALTPTGQFLIGGNIYNTSAKGEVVIPAELQFGYARKVGNRLILELDGQWTDWSEFGKQKIEFGDGTTATVTRDWADVWSLGLGGEFVVSDRFSLRAGYAFLDSPIPGGTFEASTPDADLHALTFGGGFAMGSVTVDLAAQLFFLNDRHINNGVTLAGNYETNAQYYAMNVGYKFGAR